VAGARNFSDLDYMRGETPAFFYTAITEGRGEMPSFREGLTSDERWDIVFYVWRFSTSAETLTLGESIYGASCAACHGVGGTGQVLGAADFTDLRLTDARAPRDFYLVVTQGKGSMPAWQGRLSQDERWAVIDYLRTFSYDPALPGEAVVAAPATVEAEAECDLADLEQSNPFAWEDASAAAAGEAIYEEDCAMCHAADGSGALPSAPDFSTAEFQSELRFQSGELLCVVAEGRGAMPGWKERLIVEQLWQVLTFIASLGK
jgi:mono/diheme cytochrome c family protein